MTSLISFSDGSSMSIDDSTMEGLMLAVERAIRGFRGVVSFREGEIRIGLVRRYYLPVLWTLTQVEGVAPMQEEVEFMGVALFLKS